MKPPTPAKRTYRQNNTDQVVRVHLKHKGIIVEATRVRLVNAVLVGCRALLRNLDADEQDMIMTDLWNHPHKRQRPRKARLTS